MLACGPLREALDVLFNSLHFAAFFPVVVILFFACPQRIRPYFLLAASLYFYMAARPEHVLVLFASTGIAFGGALWIARAADPGRKKQILIVALAGELTLLAVFKYAAFAARTLDDLLALATPGHAPVVAIPNIALPIGISFFTFQGASYLIDVARGRAEPVTSPLRFLLYKTFFPQLVAGPIERVRHLMPQLEHPVAFEYRRVTDGLKLMAWGFFKKMVIADRLAVYVDAVYAHPDRFAGGSLYTAALFFLFQIYCDFSGYTDIAIGAAQVLGIELCENFRRPFFATSMPEFWRRWHISLMSWFFDYLYFPLASRRRDPAARHRALFIVFLLSGLWHGASWTFVVWGLIQAVLVVSSELTKELRGSLRARVGVPKDALRLRLFNVFVTFHLVLFSFVFFRADSTASALAVLTRMPLLFEAGASEVMLQPGELGLMYGLILLLVGIELAQTRVRLRAWIAARPAILRWSLYTGVLGAILILGRFEENTFIYFSF